MNKKTPLFLFFLFFLSAGVANSSALGTGIGAAPEWLEALAPGADTIINNPVEYRKALDKFSEAQVRLSITDCAIAYYGFSSQPGFSPDAPAGEEDMQRAIMAEDYETAYELGVSILQHAPVNLTALYWTLFAATETGKPWEVRNALRGKYNSVTYIISLSGSGIAPDSAFRVVWNGDMYTYTMLELGLEIGDGFLWDGRWTEFEVTPAVSSGEPGASGGARVRFGHPSIFFELWDGR